MNAVLCVALGGAVGSILRWLTVISIRGGWGVMVVNILGSFLAGILIGQKVIELDKMRLLLITGLLGGFTTFSAFSLETLEYFLAGAFNKALLNVAVQVMGSLLAVWIGYRLVS